MSGYLEKSAFTASQQTKHVTVFNKRNVDKLFISKKKKKKEKDTGSCEVIQLFAKMSLWAVI